MLVGSASSGRVGFSSSSVSFGFISDAVILAGSIKIWPIFSQIRWDLAESRQDLTKSQRDLAGSCRIWTRSRQDFVGSRPILWVSSKFLPDNFKYHRILYVFVEEPLNIAESFWVYDQVGLLGFWKRKTTNQPEGIGFHGQRPATDRRSVGLGGFGSSSGGLVEYTGWVDSPSVLIEFNLFLFISSILEKTSKHKKLIVMSSVKYLISSFCSLELYIKNKFVD